LPMTLPLMTGRSLFAPSPLLSTPTSKILALFVCFR
jgi:hypothetical protein